MARLNSGTISRRTVEGLRYRRTRGGVLGPRPFGLRGEGLSLGSKGLRGPDKGRGEVTADHHRAARAGIGGADSAQGGDGDR